MPRATINILSVRINIVGVNICVIVWLGIRMFARFMFVYVSILFVRCTDVWLKKEEESNYISKSRAHFPKF